MGQGLGLGLGVWVCASSSRAAGMGPPPHAASPAARSWVSALRPSDRGLDEACAAAGVSDSRHGGGTTPLSASSLLPPHAASERSANARNSCEAKPSRKQKPARTRHAGAFEGASISGFPRDSTRATPTAMGWAMPKFCQERAKAAMFAAWFCDAAAAATLHFTPNQLNSLIITSITTPQMQDPQQAKLRLACRRKVSFLSRASLACRP